MITLTHIFWNCTCYFIKCYATVNIIYNDNIIVIDNKFYINFTAKIVKRRKSRENAPDKNSN